MNTEHVSDQGFGVKLKTNSYRHTFAEAKRRSPFLLQLEGHSGGRGSCHQQRSESQPPIDFVCKPDWCTLQLRPEYSRRKVPPWVLGPPRPSLNLLLSGSRGRGCLLSGYEFFRSEEVWWLAVRIRCENLSAAALSSRPLRRPCGESTWLNRRSFSSVRSSYGFGNRS